MHLKTINSLTLLFSKRNNFKLPFNFPLHCNESGNEHEQSQNVLLLDMKVAEWILKVTFIRRIVLRK